MKYLFCYLIALVLGATAVAEEKKGEKNSMNSSNEVAVIKTSEGDMVVQFWTDAAPKTIENFKKLARQGFYRRKSTRLNSSHSQISYAVFCLKKKKKKQHTSLIC